MKKNANLFLSIGNRNLYWDLVLAEFRYPILFTCVDDADGMYVVTCFRANAHEQCWLVAKTTPRAVISLLHNYLSIREIFPSGKDIVYWATQICGAEKPSVRSCRAEDVPEDLLPTPGMFMDGDADEFREELAELEWRAKHSIDFGYRSFAELNYVIHILPSFQMPYTGKKDNCAWRNNTINKELRVCYG